MFSFLLSFSWVLIAAAIIPAAFLLRYIYKKDRLEKESPKLLLNLVIMGVISTAIAIVGESVGSFILALFFNDETSVLYNILMYFVVVGVSEEGGKYLVLKKRTWNNPEFNCQFDGVVYATFVSLGFALWENIEYVLMYGMSTAVVRAFTAVPGHCCFGVFMGLFYGMARKYENNGLLKKAESARKSAVIVPVLIHGAYDFIATMESEIGGFLFMVFIAIVFFICFRMVKRLSDNDEYITRPDSYNLFR